MKKRMVALLTAVCLVAAPVSVLAEETDYSYLEDMSVKELKELRDAINEILGDGGGTSGEDVAAEHPEWDALDAESDPYATAIVLGQAFKESMYVPDSFQLRGMRYYKQGATDWFYIEYSAQNSFGGISGQATLVEMKNGEVKGTYQKDDKNFMNYSPDAWDVFWDMREAKVGDALDYQFIEYKMG